MASPVVAVLLPVAEALALPPSPAGPLLPPRVELVLLALPVSPVEPVLPEWPELTVVVDMLRFGLWCLVANRTAGRYRSRRC